MARAYRAGHKVLNVNSSSYTLVLTGVNDLPGNYQIYLCFEDNINSQAYVKAGVLLGTRTRWTCRMSSTELFKGDLYYAVVKKTNPTVGKVISQVGNKVLSGSGNQVREIIFNRCNNCKAMMNSPAYIYTKWNTSQKYVEVYSPTNWSGNIKYVAMSTSLLTGIKLL